MLLPILILCVRYESKIHLYTQCRVQKKETYKIWPSPKVSIKHESENSKLYKLPTVNIMAVDYAEYTQLIYR